MRDAHDTELKFSPIRSFGASRRTALRTRQRLAWQVYYQAYSLEIKDLSDWSDRGSCPKIVEIGCGMGEAIVELALKNPCQVYLGIDIYKPGLARILQECHDRNLSNLKILAGDALVALEQFKPESLRGFNIFFPDPWPKSRHHKRRFMRSSVIAKMGECLEKGGFLYFVTDWLPYASQVLGSLTISACFKNKEEAHTGFFQGTIDRPSTRFEKKGIEKGHKIWELYFEKV